MAFSIRNLKIRNQILLVTVPPLFALLCALVLFLYAYWSAITAERAAQRSSLRIANCESFLRHATDATSAVRGFVFTHRQDILTPYDRAVMDAQNDLNALTDLFEDDVKQSDQVARIRTIFDLLQRQWTVPTIDAARAGRDERTTEPLLSNGLAMNAALRSEVLKLRQEAEAQNLVNRSRAERVGRRILWIGIGLGLLLAGVVVFFTGAVTRQIVAPVLQLIHASEQVGRGDFSPNLPPVLDNEFGVLSSSFGNMTAALHREREEIASLNQFSEAVTQCTSEVEVYDLLLHSLRERFHPRQVVIFQLKQTEGFLEAVASLVPLPKELRQWPVIEEPGNCKAVRTGRSFVVNNVRTEPLCPSKFALPIEGSYYCGPLIAGGNVIGSLRMETEREFWTPDRRRLVESYLSGAATALSNLRLLTRMKEQANIDILTGLYNRRFVEDYARKMFAIARRKDQPLGVLMLDLDHFKDFNDIYGHEMGDRILRHFAKAITGAMREANLAARFGGEEFVVVLTDTNTESGLLVAERIRKAVLTMVVPSESEKPLPQLTVSVGVASYPEHGQNWEEVMKASDKALYESKRAGRNRVTAARLEWAIAPSEDEPGPDIASS